MQYSRAGLQLTEGFEGCRLQSYQDQTGKWTIGYGHTYQVGSGMSCTQQQAEIWLRTDMAFAEQVVETFVKVPLSQGEYDALVDFCFNCGSGNLKASTLLKLVNAGDFANAALEFDKWDHAGGQVVAGLLRRREAEKQEFLTPDPPQSA